MSDGIWCAGVDGGGTKTEVLMILAEQKPVFTAQSDQQGNSESVRFHLGSINVNGVGRATAAANMTEAFRRIRGLARGDLRVCVGSAGLSNPEQKKMILDCARETGIPESAIVITGDQDIALEGAFSGGDGILIIAGTGSICYGQYQGRRYRCGGYGHLLDDEGSGYAIGRDILREVIRIHDGRAEDSLLWPLVVNRLGTLLHDERIMWYAQDIGMATVRTCEPAGTDMAGDGADFVGSGGCMERRDTDVTGEAPDAAEARYTVQQMIHYVYDPSHGKAGIADFASLLDTALDAGDPAARCIAENAAKELSLLVETVASEILSAANDARTHIVAGVQSNSVQDNTRIGEDVAGSNGVSGTIGSDMRMVSERPMIRCSCSGSVLTKSTHMALYLQRVCAARELPIQFIDPENDAVEGAVLMAYMNIT